MKGIICTAATSILLALTVACTAEKPGPTEADFALDPAALIDQALAAMGQLHSYHLAFISPAPPEDVRREFRWEAEFAAPDSYRFLLFGAEGESKKVCESYIPPEGGSGQTCYEVLTKITRRTLHETVIAADKAYSRQCEDVGKGCGDWQEGPRPPVAIAGPAPSFLPQWPLVALEMAQAPQIIGGEKLDGEPVIHLRAHVNQLRAILETERRVFTAVGITSFGEACEVTPGGQERCRQLTFEEALEQQEPTLSFYDQHPATMDAWVSEGDLVRRIVFQIPPDETGAQEATFTIEYSRFNEVTIEPPR